MRIWVPYAKERRGGQTVVRFLDVLTLARRDCWAWPRCFGSIVGETRWRHRLAFLAALPFLPDLTEPGCA